jgi:hypothetical protein
LATASFVAGLAHPVHCGQENVPAKRADVHLRLLNLDLFRLSADALAVAMAPLGGGVIISSPVR